MKPVAPRDSATKSVLPAEIHWGQLIVAPRWENIGTILIEEEITPMSFSEDASTVQTKRKPVLLLVAFSKEINVGTLLECEIECCTSDNCNTQVPTLSKDAITVFTPNDKKAACAAIGGYLKDEFRVSVLQCEIECCTGDNCNTHVPTLPPTGSSIHCC
ncbi:hypothetical protein OS493_038468 [Desmophyllum pertusum]|uniref:Uncharacterized protein n=1 Tax=Desmophyllum pertusum TaxID=174260 RepID=A0A9W9ZJ21_9CNID|nr:hypothetical protein OS493_038468 [Desmophyllum pertusum]